MDGNLRISEGSKWGIIRSVTWDNRNFRWESEPVVINPRLTFIVMIIFNKNTLRNYVFDYLRIVNTEEYCTMNETAISTHFIFIILRNIENLLDEFSLILSEMTKKWNRPVLSQKKASPSWVAWKDLNPYPRRRHLLRRASALYARRSQLNDLSGF